MKFIKGFIIGTAVGVAIGSAMGEQQRRELTAKVTSTVKRQAQPIADAARQNTKKVADTFTERAVEKIDDAGDTAEEAVS
jgi:hypothetical protein